MKIQLTPNRIVTDAIVVWNQPGPEVDVTMDLSKITFKENSIDEIYSFHVLDHLFFEEGGKAISNWLKCLKPGGEIYIVVDDFEYVCRSYVGGDIKIEDLNASFAHPSFYDRYNLALLIRDSGIAEENIKVWFADVPDRFGKKHYELVISATKK